MYLPALLRYTFIFIYLTAAMFLFYMAYNAYEEGLYFFMFLRIAVALSIFVIAEFMFRILRDIE